MMILDAIDGRSRTKAEYARLWQWGEESGRSRVRRSWDELVFSAMHSLTFGGRRKLKAGDVPGAWWPVWKRMAKRSGAEPEPERPPDRETAVQYFAARGMGKLGERFFDYYNSRGWRTKTGERVTSWKSAAANWIRDQPRFEGRRNTNGHAKKGTTYTYGEAVRIWQQEGGGGKFPGSLFEKVEGEAGGKPRYRRK